MSVAPLTKPHWIKVNRSELRQKQRATLKRAKGRSVVLIFGADKEEEKLVIDKEYFDEVLKKLRAAVETLSITMDERLYGQILAAAETLDKDIRRGKLRSFEEAFGEK